MDDYAFRGYLKFAIKNIEGIIQAIDAEANSGGGGSIDAVNEQRRLKGKIEGLKLALEWLEQERRVHQDRT